MKIPPTQTLKHESHFWPGLMLLGLLYAAFMALPTPSDSEIESPGIFIAMGLLGAVFCFGMMLYRPSLTLSKSGFQFRYPFKSFSHKWTDVSKFEVKKSTKGTAFVSLSVRQGTEIITKSFETSFGFKPSGLKGLLEEYREYALFAEAKNINTDLAELEKVNYAKFANQE